MEGPALSGEGLRDLVESALESEDITPLVRRAAGRSLGCCSHQWAPLGLASMVQQPAGLRHTCSSPPSPPRTQPRPAVPAPAQVRLVFDVHPAEPLPVPVPLDSESGTTTLDEAAALLRENPLEAVLEALQEVAEDKEAEIEQICR